jgi:hypothetical protein
LKYGWENVSFQRCRHVAECRGDYICKMRLFKSCRPTFLNWRMPAGVHGSCGFDSRSLWKHRESLALCCRQ